MHPPAMCSRAPYMHTLGLHQVATKQLCTMRLELTCAHKILQRVASMHELCRCLMGFVASLACTCGITDCHARVASLTGMHAWRHWMACTRGVTGMASIHPCSMSSRCKPGSWDGGFAVSQRHLSWRCCQCAHQAGAYCFDFGNFWKQSHWAASVGSRTLCQYHCLCLKSPSGQV